MYNGIDAVDVGMQPIKDNSQTKIIYFITFIFIVSFFVLNMFVGVIVENFQNFHAQHGNEQNKIEHEKIIQRKQSMTDEVPYYARFSPWRERLHQLCINKYFDLIIAAIIGLNIFIMSLEFHEMPRVRKIKHDSYIVKPSSFRSSRRLLIIAIIYLHRYLYSNISAKLSHLDHHAILKTSEEKKSFELF